VARIFSAIQVSRSALLTARVADGAEAAIYVLAEAGSPKSSLSLPRLRDIKEAGTILVKELTATSPLLHTPASSHEKGKRRDWLGLLLRESLGTISVI
jgi:AAA family ATPase